MGDIADSRRDGRLSPPSPITAAHDLAAFNSGDEPLDDWLRLRAMKSEGRSSRTYIVVDGSMAVGYYCLSTGAEKRTALPARLSRNTPDPVPLVLLGRLAVDLRYQGKGVGAGLLKDALQRVAQVSRAVGSRAVLVHAIDQNARTFYMRYGFIEFPEGSRTLFLPIETIVAGLG